MKGPNKNNDKLDELKSAQKPNLEKDYSRITNPNESAEDNTQKVPNHNRFLKEKSVKLSECVLNEKKLKSIRKKKKKNDVASSPIPALMTQSYPYVTPIKPSSNVYVNMMQQFTEFQSKQFQLLIQCHYQIMDKLIDKAFDK